MKYLTLTILVFITTTLSSYASSSSTNIVIEIIKFDCTKHPELFNKYSSAYDARNLIDDYSYLIAELKSSELPRKIVLHHTQTFVPKMKTKLSTTQDNAQFDLEVTPTDDSDIVNLKIDHSKQIGEFRNQRNNGTIMSPGTLRILEYNSETSSSGGAITRQSIDVFYVSIEISG